MARNFKDWITAYLEYVDETEPSDLYKKWTAVSTLAAVMQRKCYLLWDDFTFPNFYIVLIGPTGCRKSSAMRPAQDLLRAVGVPLASDAITRRALISELNESSGMNVFEGEPHASLTVFSKELSVFLGQDNRQMMIDLIDWYDCDSKWIYRTQTQGHEIIPNVWVNMLGATTPELLQSSVSMDAYGGGLIGRMIFVYAAEKGKTVIFPWLSDKKLGVRDKLIEDLSMVNSLHGEYKITQEVLDFWAEWYPQQTGLMADNARLTGYEDRKPKHLLKLAMVMAMSRSDGMIISLKDINRSLKWLKETEAVMDRAFAGLGASDKSALKGKVQRILSLKGEMDMERLYSMIYYDCSKQELLEILKDLKLAGQLSLRLDDIQNMIITPTKR